MTSDNVAKRGRVQYIQYRPQHRSLGHATPQVLATRCCPLHVDYLFTILKVGLRARSFDPPWFQRPSSLRPAGNTKCFLTSTAWHQAGTKRYKVGNRSPLDSILQNHLPLLSTITRNLSHFYSSNLFLSLSPFNFLEKKKTEWRDRVSNAGS